MKKIIIKILIFLILIFIIILGLIIFNLKKGEKIEQNINNEYFFSDNEKEILNNYFYDITYENEFFEIEEFIDGFYEECTLNDEDIVLNFLDKNYINQNRIEKNNIFEKINYEKNYNNFFAKKIYHQYDMSNEDEQWSMYYVTGILWSDDYKNKKEIFIIINKNLNDENLYIYPQDNINLNENNFQELIYQKQKEFLINYHGEENSLLEDDEEKLEEEIENEVDRQKELAIGDETNEEIEYDEDEEPAGEPEDDEEDEYAVWEDNYYQITVEDIARRLYSEFTIMMIYDTEESYNLLTEEFKNNNFKDLNKYKKYIEKNTEKILNGKIEKYKQKYNIIDEEKYDTIYSAINSNKFYFNFYIDSNKNLSFDFKEI